LAKTTTTATPTRARKEMATVTVTATATAMEMEMEMEMETGTAMETGMATGMAMETGTGMEMETGMANVRTSSRDKTAHRTSMHAVARTCSAMLFPTTKTRAREPSARPARARDCRVPRARSAVAT
jgi:hypothetical protein